jgi:hypothetical protein
MLLVECGRRTNRWVADDHIGGEIAHDRLKNDA